MDDNSGCFTCQVKGISDITENSDESRLCCFSPEVKKYSKDIMRTGMVTPKMTGGIEFNCVVPKGISDPITKKRLITGHEIKSTNAFVPPISKAVNYNQNFICGNLGRKLTNDKEDWKGKENIYPFGCTEKACEPYTEIQPEVVEECSEDEAVKTVQKALSRAYKKAERSYDKAEIKRAKGTIKDELGG